MSSQTELRLPAKVGSAKPLALFAFAKSVIEAAGDLSISAEEVTWIDPLGLAVLGCLIEPLMQKGRRVEMPWWNPDLATYLERMDFTARCPAKELAPRASGRRRNDLRLKLFELTRVDSPDRADEVSQRLVSAVTGISPDEWRNDSVGYPLGYSLAELLNNSLSHARRCGYQHASVWVTAQAYKDGRVQMAIVDNGCGMLPTLFHHPQLKEKSHQTAIATALMPRVSCNRGFGKYLESENAGVGLTTTYRIAEAAGGGLTIVTGDALYRHGHLGSMAEGWWQGVAVLFECNRERLANVDVRKLLPAIEAPPVALRFEN